MKEPNFRDMALMYLRCQPSNAGHGTSFLQRGSAYRARIAPKLAELLRKCFLLGVKAAEKEPAWLETMRQRTNAADVYAKTRDFMSTLPNGKEQG